MDNHQITTISNTVSEKNEIIVYQPEGGEFHIEVRVEQDSAWLTQAQMAELFGTDRTSITRHIRNIYQTKELEEYSTCAKIAQVRTEGERKISRTIPFYNLDMIISVGYRVNSICGTQFRRWANKILKEHMLKGFSVNQRLISHENNLENLDSRMINLEKQVDFFVKANLPPKEGVLQAKALWSGYEFATQLVRSAQKEIIIIDPFADDTALSLMFKRNPEVNAIIYSARINQTMKAECERLNRQLPHVELRNLLTAFSVLQFITKDDLLKMVR